MRNRQTGRETETERERQTEAETEMEHLVTTGMMNMKQCRGKSKENMTEGITQWPYLVQMCQKC